MNTDWGYIKALSIHNIADMVYARQVFCEPGMLPGLHLCRMDGETVAIPDSGWIVWFDRGEAVYETMADEDFKNRFVPYDHLPADKKVICDAHPGYNEWCDIMDRKFMEKEGACLKN